MTPPKDDFADNGIPQPPQRRAPNGWWIFPSVAIGLAMWAVIIWAAWPYVEGL